jgi:hypothetical protein
MLHFKEFSGLSLDKCRMQSVGLSWWAITWYKKKSAPLECLRFGLSEDGRGAAEGGPQSGSTRLPVYCAPIKIGSTLLALQAAADVPEPAGHGCAAT